MSTWPLVPNHGGVQVHGRSIMELTRADDFAFLHNQEWLALMKLPTVIGYVAVAQMVTLPPQELRTALQAFIAAENERQAQLLGAQEANLTSLQQAALASGRSSPRPNNGLKLKIST